MLADFEDTEEGGFFFTSDSHESLLARAKDPFDGALPSGNSVAILDLIALSRASGSPDYRDHAGKALKAFSTVMAETPAGMPLGVVGLLQFLDKPADRITPRPLAEGALEDNAPAVVSATVRLASNSANAGAITPGKDFDARVTITIQNGWHIYANPVGLAEMRPTVLELDPAAAKAVELIKVSYPEGKSQPAEPALPDRIYTYEGKVELGVRLRVAETADSGLVSVPFVLSYQACNDQLCQAPAKLRVLSTVKIARPGAGVK
jgi:hypothetical protein